MSFADETLFKWKFQRAIWNYFELPIYTRSSIRLNIEMEQVQYFGGDSLISSLLLSLVDELCFIDFFFFFFFFTEINPINKND